VDVDAFITRLRDELKHPDRAWTNAADQREMIVITEGWARLGAEAHRERLPGFAMSRHPVTNGEYARFLRESSYHPHADHPDPGRFLAHWDGEKMPPPGKEDHPVVFVSWWDAQAYCDWAGLSLPSEWMWERAARGTDGRHYPWGDRSPRPDLAQIRARATTPIGHRPDVRTATGCEDMIGNISEWCSPDPDPNYRPSGKQLPGGTPWMARLRGSAFMRVDRGQARMTTFYSRKLSATRRNKWVGFRPAYPRPMRAESG